MALRRRGNGSATAEAVGGPVRLGPGVDDVLQRSHRGDVALLDVVDLSAAQAQALIGRGFVAVVVIGTLRTGGGRLVASGMVVVEQVGTHLWTLVGEGAVLTVDPLSGEIADADGQRLTVGAVRAVDAPTRASSDELPRTAQLLRDASSLLGEMPAIDDPEMVASLLELQAAHRPIAVVGAGPCQHTVLRRWAASVNPVVVCTEGGLSTARTARLGVDVLVSRTLGEAEPGFVRAPIVVGDAEHGSALPDEVTALLVARAAGSTVVTTWGIATGRDALLGLPRETGALQMAAVLAAGALPLDGETVAAATPSVSPIGTLAVALAGVIAGLAILSLSDPGLTFIHRMFG